MTLVVPSLALGGIVGVVLSGGFIWWEIGKYAAPQVSETVFDERKLLAGYTVGLFVGVPLAASYVLMAAAFANGALPGAALFLGLLVGGTELAQRLVGRSRYWGSTLSTPFYLLAFRLGIGGILALTVVASYLGAPAFGAVGAVATAFAALAVVALQAAGALLSLGGRLPPSSRPGSVAAGALFGAGAFFLLAFGPAAGDPGTVGAPIVVLAGAAFAYRGRRGILGEVPGPSSAAAPLPTDRPPRYGRTEEGRAESPRSDRPLR